MSSENGAEAFARLVSIGHPRDTCKLVQMEDVFMVNKKIALDSHIFSNGGIKNKQVIEIFGKLNSGKSELLMHFMARSLLPVKWKIDLKTFQEFDDDSKSVTVDLSEHSVYSGSEEFDEPEKLGKVILIETTSKFSILRMFTILENRVLRSFHKIRASNSTAAKLKLSQIQSLMNKFLKDCLKNLVTFKCYNSDQFIFSLVACDHFIQSTYQEGKAQRSIIPIFIDSVNFNFECVDKYSNQIGASEANCTENFGLTLIKRLVERFNVSVIATRLDCTYSFGEANQYSFFPYKKWQTLVDHRLELVDTNESTEKTFEDHQENPGSRNKRILRLINAKAESMQEVKPETAHSIQNTLIFSIENDGFHFQNISH